MAQDLSPQNGIIAARAVHQWNPEKPGNEAAYMRLPGNAGKVSAASGIKAGDDIDEKPDADKNEDGLERQRQPDGKHRPGKFRAPAIADTPKTITGGSSHHARNRARRTHQRRKAFGMECVMRKPRDDRRENPE